MPQLLLMPDPRPLVERWGPVFFRQAPEGPGVYLMRDAADVVLYVGKAKNLRKRLASYRVANPDRLRRRHLRLLRAVARIELQECRDEPSALARESELLRDLRPRFNRAGTWPGPPRFLAWKLTNLGLALAIFGALEPGWICQGPFGSAAIGLRAMLVRLLWCALHPERGLAGMPEGWFAGRHSEIVLIPRRAAAAAEFDQAEKLLAALFAGESDAFAEWVRERTAGQSHPFESGVRDADLESVTAFVNRLRTSQARSR